MTEKSKTMVWLATLAGVAALACASSKIEGHGASAYAPVNDQQPGGTLKYYVGLKSREELYKEMHDYCGGAYEITNERVDVLGTTTTVTNNSIQSSSTRQGVIDFRCVGRQGMVTQGNEGMRGPLQVVLQVERAGDPQLVIINNQGAPLTGCEVRSPPNAAYRFPPGPSLAPGTTRVPYSYFTLDNRPADPQVANGSTLINCSEGFLYAVAQ